MEGRERYGNIDIDRLTYRFSALCVRLRYSVLDKGL